MAPWQYGKVEPRSGLAGKQITVDAGTIDNDYRGPLRVLMVNRSAQFYGIQRGDKIAQLIIQPYCQEEVIEVDALAETMRGAAGFGSSGV